MTNDDLRAAVRQLFSLDSEISDVEAKLKELKESRRRLSEVTIPEMMEELGVTKMVLDSGETVSTKMDVYASVPSENWPDALGWLEANGLGDIIKTRVSLTYGRGEREAAVKMADYLSSTGAAVTLEEKVHPLTLRATIKELLAKGVDVPLDVFGAREYMKTVVKIK